MDCIENNISPPLIITKIVVIFVKYKLYHIVLRPVKVLEGLVKILQLLSPAIFFLFL